MPNHQGFSDISLGELEEYDPDFSTSGNEQRFCCPFPECCDKPMDSDHRSLSVNVESGLWQCFRCGRRGVLREHCKPDHKNRAKTRMNRAELHNERRLDPGTLERLKVQLDDTVEIGGTPGENYLRLRRIPSNLAADSDVLYAPAWGNRDGYGGFPAVVFLLRNRSGRVTAAAGRSVEGREHIVFGVKKDGVFQTLGGMDADPLIITEAPIDALSLAACGFPAIALAGRSFPGWLPSLGVHKTVIIATDCDKVGNEAADRLAKAMQPYARKCMRIIPPRVREWCEPGWHSVQTKDWNQALVREGVETLTNSLAEVIRKCCCRPP